MVQNKPITIITIYYHKKVITECTVTEWLVLNIGFELKKSWEQSTVSHMKMCLQVIVSNKPLCETSSIKCFVAPEGTVPNFINCLKWYCLSKHHLGLKTISLKIEKSPYLLLLSHTCFKLLYTTGLTRAKLLWCISQYSHNYENKTQEEKCKAFPLVGLNWILYLFVKTF